jgi:para-nitrobenzyl esterase
VKTGDPNGEGLPTWPAFTLVEPKVMHLHAGPAVGPVPNPDQLKVLDAYFAARRADEAPPLFPRLILEASRQ